MPGEKACIQQWIEKKSDDDDDESTVKSVLLKINEKSDSLIYLFRLVVICYERKRTN